MPTIKSIIEKMHTQPAGVRFEELRRVLENSGYRLVRVKGSHAHFRSDSGDVITIKRENPIKAVYIKDVLNRLEK